MKKIIAILLAALTPALFLTGCAYEDLSVKLNKDGTGSVSTTIGVRKDLVEELMSGRNPFDGKETEEVEIDGKTYVACTEVKEYGSFEEIEKVLSEMTYDVGDLGDAAGDTEQTEESVDEPVNFDGFSDDLILTDPEEEEVETNEDGRIFKSVSVEKDGSKYIFHAVVNKFGGQIQGYDVSDIFRIGITVEMPASIRTYMNGKVEGKKITFDLSDMSKETELYAECKVASVVPIIVCGVIAAGCLAAFFVLKRKKK